MRHLRVAHSRFSNLTESKAAANEEGELALPDPSATRWTTRTPRLFRGPVLKNLEPLSSINPWSRRSDEDYDVGRQDAEKCLHWMG
jgi:hypothetical protein